MRKKTYQKPNVEVIRVQSQSLLEESEGDGNSTNPDGGLVRRQTYIIDDLGDEPEED